MTVEATPDANRNFVAQQGFEGAPACSYATMTSALLFQPRVIGVWVLLGAVLQSGWPFAVLSAVLWWSALVPMANPFELFYNAFLAGGSGRPHLNPAPAPRRFSQGMAGTFAGAIAAALFAGSRGAALGFGIALLLALGALLFGRMCVGSFIYYLLRGKLDFALRTLPWGRGV